MTLAGLTPPLSMDGRAIQFDEKQEIERNMLIEYYGEARNDSVDPNCPWKYDSDNLAVRSLIMFFLNIPNICFTFF